MWCARRSHIGGCLGPRDNLSTNRYHYYCYFFHIVRTKTKGPRGDLFNHRSCSLDGFADRRAFTHRGLLKCLYYLVSLVKMVFPFFFQSFSPSLWGKVIDPRSLKKPLDLKSSGPSSENALYQPSSKRSSRQQVSPFFTHPFVFYLNPSPSVLRRRVISYIDLWVLHIRVPSVFISETFMVDVVNFLMSEISIYRFRLGLDTVSDRQIETFLPT